MLVRLVRRLSGSPDRAVLLLRYLRPRKCCLHLHELDMKRFLHIDCLLQNLDFAGNRISCSCRSSSIHAPQQTLVMPQSRCDVLFAGSLQICSVPEDSSFLLPSTFLRHCSRETGSVMRSEALSLHLGCDSSSHRQSCATTRSTLVPVPRGTPRDSNETVGVTRKQAHSEERSLLSNREETTHKQGECNIRTERRVKSAFFRTLGLQQQQQRQNLVTCTFEPLMTMNIIMMMIRGHSGESWSATRSLLQTRSV